MTGQIQLLPETTIDLESRMKEQQGSSTQILIFQGLQLANNREVKWLAKSILEYNVSSPRQLST